MDGKIPFYNKDCEKILQKLALKTTKIHQLKNDLTLFDND